VQAMVRCIISITGGMFENVVRRKEYNLGVPENLAESRPLEPDTCNQVVGKVDGVIKILHRLRCYNLLLFQRTLVRRNNSKFMRLVYEVFYDTIKIGINKKSSFCAQSSTPFPLLVKKNLKYSAVYFAAVISF
jgi:hypothetical protein